MGYAGTMDLVARINGRICLIDYKTKGTTRDGTVKPLDDKVVMQLVAGMKAEESLVDPAAGNWEPWKYGETRCSWPWPSAKRKSGRSAPTRRSSSTIGGSSAPCGGSGSFSGHGRRRPALLPVAPPPLASARPSVRAWSRLPACSD